MTRRQIKLNRKKIAIASLIGSIAIVMVGVVYAAVTGPTFKNEFNVNGMNLIATDTGFADGFGDRSIKIENKEDSTNALLRVRFVETFRSGNDADLNGIELYSNKVNGKFVTSKVYGDDWEDFISGGDGWYYYTKVLPVGETLDILKSVTINNAISDEAKAQYADYDYDLVFMYEAIQDAETDAPIEELWGKGKSEFIK